MNVCLLYRDSDRPGNRAYEDADNIIRDLGLKALFQDSARRLKTDSGKVLSVEEEDPFIAETMRRVMMIPLSSREEVEYRHAVLKDCIRHEDLVRTLYLISCRTLEEWNMLGRGGREKAQQVNPAVKLAESICALRLLCDSLREIRELAAGEDRESGKPLSEGFASEGFRSFFRRLREVFSEEREREALKVLEDISFFMDGGDGGGYRTIKARIVLECGLEDGLKFSSMKLREVSSESLRFFRPGTTMKKLQDLKYSRIPDSFPVDKDPRLSEQARQLEFSVVCSLAGRLNDFLMPEFQTFFDQLKIQAAFYLGAVQLKAQLERFDMDVCFPEVSDRRTLAFRDLKECVMGLRQRVHVIGNTCDMENTDLLIVTGANQGGKSTFLRSIGIAQVMAQCGLPVAAGVFRSGLFPRIFVHFTRREDSSMNSGRLDEELGRMDRIVDLIGEGSLVLLNESFATTTEKEGSLIAYDIVRALGEAGVKILMVTHLLPFAKRMYDERKDDPASGTAFLSAERTLEGIRTFRMIPHPPEMTSFGLDLFEEIVEKHLDGHGGARRE
ncbi:MAG: hypothetical protein IKP22_13685 [Clostridia bacterium]|nr:hypothetical protein [Clostridia bacterium]